LIELDRTDQQSGGMSQKDSGNSSAALAIQLDISCDGAPGTEQRELK
jgi:hypothetical protein